MVVAVGETTNGLPYPTSVPPHEPVYQAMVVPTGAAAVSVLVPPKQMGEVAVTVVGVAIAAETVTVTERQADGEQLVLSVRA